MERPLTIFIPTYAKILKESHCMVRLLESLRRLDDSDFRVIILNTTNPPDPVVEDKISGLVKRFGKHFPIMSVSVMDLWKIHEFMESKGFEIMKDKINFNPFSNFRNMCFIVSHILKSGLVLMIDDDEVVCDKEFLSSVREGMGETFQRKPILGKTGYYLYGSSHVLRPKGVTRKRLWPSVQLINKTMKSMIQCSERYCKTSIALGGIMVFSKRLFTRIPFDPYCIRGEDTNYVISCKQFGMNFVFDNKLMIKHHPPREKIDFYKKFRKDIYRFVYERERLESFGNVEVEELDPYPGFFLRDDLAYRAASVCLNYATRAYVQGDKKCHTGHIRNMEILFNDAQQYAARNIGRYLKFQKRWTAFMKKVGKSNDLYKHFNRF